MRKEFTTLQLFTLIDGRLSTTIDDVYNTLNHICDTQLMTHHLPVAMSYLRSKNPSWFSDLKNKFNNIGITSDTNFQKALHICESINSKHNIPQLKDEFSTEDFDNYMVNNSLLLKIGTKAT